jgi:hypothetical protein
MLALMLRSPRQVHNCQDWELLARRLRARFGKAEVETFIPLCREALKVRDST